MPDCSRCGEFFTTGHFQRHLIESDVHRRSLRGSVPAVRVCQRCRVAYEEGSYQEHKRGEAHLAVVSRRSQSLPLCSVCRERYEAGKYRLHRLTEVHLVAIGRRLVG